jgi:hypothetical protein
MYEYFFVFSVSPRLLTSPPPSAFMIRRYFFNDNFSMAADPYNNGRMEHEPT